LRYASGHIGKQTYRQTYIHSDHYTLHPYRGEVIIIKRYVVRVYDKEFVIKIHSMFRELQKIE